MPGALDGALRCAVWVLTCDSYCPVILSARMAAMLIIIISSTAWHSLASISLPSPLPSPPHLSVTPSVSVRVLERGGPGIEGVEGRGPLGSSRADRAQDTGHLTSPGVLVCMHLYIYRSSSSYLARRLTIQTGPARTVMSIIYGLSEG